jgi:hypothetical protein
MNLPHPVYFMWLLSGLSDTSGIVTYRKTSLFSGLRIFRSKELGQVTLSALLFKIYLLPSGKVVPPEVKVIYYELSNFVKQKCIIRCTFKPFQVQMSVLIVFTFFFVGNLFYFFK